MANKGFEKFIKPELKGAKKKESLRQDKRRMKANARALGEMMRKKKYEKMHGIQPDESTNTDRMGKKIIDNKGPINRNTIAPKRRSILTNTNQPITNPNYKRFKEKNSEETESTSDVFMPLNKFIAHSGVCGRREAAELIKLGVVTINGDKVFEPGFKVRGNETILVKEKRIFLQRNLVYILLNKPKDYITTAKDPEGRKTAMDLIKGATKERVYAVGRLDRNTTGVLLITNDGELAQKLTHPSYEIKKIYEVKLDKPLVKKDFDAIVAGVALEDGIVPVDSLGYVDAKDKSIIGIEIHSGRNRIVRRLFEHLGYDVKGLDRVMFANLTKKNVERGRWRMLNENEVRQLKFMNQSFLKNRKSTDK